jgi:hypothetical protein
VVVDFFFSENEADSRGDVEAEEGLRKRETGFVIMLKK